MSFWTYLQPSVFWTINNEPEWEERWTTKVRAVRRPEPLSLINHLLSAKLIKDTILLSDNKWLPTWECQSSNWFPKNFKSLLLTRIFGILWNRRRIRIGCWYWFRSSPLTWKFKVITWEDNSSNMLFILKELAFYSESSPDEVKQRIWDWECKNSNYYHQYLTEKNANIERMRE